MIRSILTHAILMVSMLFSSAAIAGDTVKIALLSGFTGVANIPSYHLLHTIEMEVKRVNANGGINGRPVELVILDDESNPMKTIELARDKRLDDVAGIIGFPWSQFILSAGPTIQDRRIPAISILATHDRATKIGDHLFRVCFTNTYQGKMLVRYAFNKLKARKAVLFVDHQNSYSVDLARIIKQEFTGMGGRIVHEISYIPQKGPDFFLSELRKIDLKSFDSVFIPDDQVYVMPIMEAFARIGAVDKNYFGGDGWNMANIQIKDERLKDLPTYVVGHWDAGGRSRENREFISSFSASYNAEPQDATALSHDAFYILIEAIKKTPSLDREIIKQKLYETNYVGLTGRIQFDNDGDPVHKPLVIHKVYKGRRESYLYQ